MFHLFATGQSKTSFRRGLPGLPGESRDSLLSSCNSLKLAFRQEL